MHVHALSIPESQTVHRNPPIVAGHRSHRILIAEDDVAMRRLMAAALRAAGHRVVEASDGVDVVQRIESTIWADRHDLYDVIVSDMTMPGLSGLDMLAMLRCSDVRTPFILVTAFGDAIVRAEAKALGAAEVLAKPLELGTLQAAVERVLHAADPRLVVQVRPRRRGSRIAPIRD